MGPVGIFMAFTAATAVSSYQAQKKQAAGQRTMAEAQQKEMETRQKMADIKARRERLQTIRKARVARMTMEAQAARGGGLESSSFAGATGSIQSQEAGSVGTAMQLTSMAREQTIFNINASKQAQGYMDQASQWQGYQTIFEAGAKMSGSKIA